MQNDERLLHVPTNAHIWNAALEIHIHKQPAVLTHKLDFLYRSMHVHSHWLCLTECMCVCGVISDVSH